MSGRQGIRKALAPVVGVIGVLLLLPVQTAVVLASVANSGDHPLTKALMAGVLLAPLAFLLAIVGAIRVFLKPDRRSLRWPALLLAGPIVFIAAMALSVQSACNGLFGCSDARGPYLLPEPASLTPR